MKGNDELRMNFFEYKTLENDLRYFFKLQYIRHITLCKFKACVRAVSLSHVRLFATLWTVALQVPLSMGFSSQEYWSGLPFPTPEKLEYLNTDIKFRITFFYQHFILLLLFYKCKLNTM